MSIYATFILPSGNELTVDGAEPWLAVGDGVAVDGIGYVVKARRYCVNTQPNGRTAAGPVFELAGASS